MLKRSATPIEIGASLSLAFGLLFAPSCKSPTGSGVLEDTTPPGGGGTAAAGNTPNYDGPSGGLPPAENAQLFAKYCKVMSDPAQPDATDINRPIVPNYADPDVAAAAKILNIVKPSSFKLYNDMLKMHQTVLPTSTGIQGLNKPAHDFLTYLCGEFRDRAPMIKAKIDWVKNIRYLSKSGGGTGKSCAKGNNPMLGDALPNAMPQTEAYQPYGSPWQQMCIEDYFPYLKISRAVFDYRQSVLKSATGAQLASVDGPLATGPLTIGTRTGIDRTVPGYTICETKYIFAEYVKKAKAYGVGAASYQSYMTGYNTFKAGCSADDQAWYYDFRGDSNYKPNSPEGNAMIWMGKVAAAQCKTRGTQKPGMAMTDADCKRYYENPFRSRYLAARAGLATWLLHAKTLGAGFGSPGGSYFTIVNHAYNSPANVFGDVGPYLFRVNDGFEGGKLQTPGQAGSFMPGFQGYWGAKDMGLIPLAALTGEPAKQFLFERIQRSVDRHTNWYKSGYDSAPTLPLTSSARRTIDQAYSPFVASSYEMSMSNDFSQCGLTIPCGSATEEFSAWKQWMFIFKVRKENWFKPEDIVAGKLNPDFDKVWFDETAFGDDGLANRERAWDRLGTPTEEEHAEILYLHRIPSEN